MIKFKTLNSTYELSDKPYAIWKRTETNGLQNAEAPLRTEEGTLWSHSNVIIGRPVILIGPPVVPGAFSRIIQTSPVTEIMQ